VTSSALAQPTLHAAADAIRTGAAEIERVYLQVGDGLGKALEVVTDLTTRVEQIPAELTGERMRDASEALWRLSSEISAVAEALPVERAALEGIGRSLEGLRAPLDRLLTSVRTLVVLARSSRVESANLSGNQYNFVEFAAEISVLADKARGTIGDYAREFGQLSRLVATARDSQARFDDDRRAAIKRSVGDLQAAFDVIEERQRAAIRASDAVVEKSRHISEVVGEAIMGLQAGDSTRQRLEHVVEGLEAVQRDTGDQATFATAALQAAQLTHALGDFDTAVRGTVSSLAALGSEADEIAGLGRSLVRTGENGMSLHEALRGNLSSAGQLIRECEAARTSVDSAMAGLATTLSAFRDRLGALNTISTSITSVGLNAAIKSARLGQEGRALAVISEDLRHYAERIVDDTKVLISVFDEVLTSSATLDEARSRQDSQRMAEADVEIAGLLETLGANEAVLATALALFADAGSRLAGHHAQAERDFADLDRAMQPAREAIPALQALGRNAKAGAAPALPSGRRYSMESERRIHAALAG
jgi:methyl-accepting chemotaxis protein